MLTAVAGNFVRDDSTGGGRRGLWPRLPFSGFWRAGVLVGVLCCAGCETVSYGVRITHEGASVGVSHGDGKTVVSAEQGADRLDVNFRRKNL